MNDLIPQLQQTKLLREIPANVIQTCILPAGSYSIYKKDHHIISERDKVESVMILLSGKVNILYYFADGSYSLAASETPPRVLALDLIASKSRISPYCAVAAEDSGLFSFPASVILQPGTLPEANRQTMLEQLLIMLSHMHTQKEQHVLILSRNSLRDKIMSYLSLQAAWKKTNSFTIPFSREEMAAYLCINRSVLSHELSRMKQEGLIDFSKNHFTLLKSFY